MATFVDPVDELAPQVQITTAGGDEVDISGFESINIKLQLGAADEFTMTLPAQTVDGPWRSDMPVWQIGSYFKFHVGYNGVLEFMQGFEVVSTTVNYGEDDSGETMIVRAVSDLARAARNRNPRTFDSGDDAAIITEICGEYGWKNGVSASLTNPKERLKENGTSDLEFLKLIAREAKLGAPRLMPDNTLVMPEPTIGELKFSRGTPLKSGSDFRRLHSLSMNRDGGPNPTTVAVISFDPVKKEFVQVEYQADEFGGDPKITYEGAPSIEELPKDSTTQGLMLAVVEHRGQDKKERTDVLASGRFLDETSAIDLVRRWFELREKLSRWADVVVDGVIDLVPYTSFELDGNMATVDRGTWLPIVVDHNFSVNGWTVSMRSVRVVEEPVVTPT
jgi:phage protein D